MEVWKQVVGYEGLYEVSSFGNIKSLNYLGHGKVQVLRPGKTGEDYRKYYIVSLYNKNGKKTKRIHRLVATAFIENPLNLTSVNHIDNDSMNNNVKNLEWCNRRDNVNHGHLFRKRSSKHAGVYFDKSRNKWGAQIQIKGKHILLGRFALELDAAKAYQDKLSEIYRLFGK